MISWREKSFDELPALAVRGKMLRYCLRTVTTAWMFGIVWMAGIGGSQFVDFCWLLGFRDFDFGLIAAIPCAATFSQLFVAVFIERTGLRKYTFIYLATIHRLLWLVIAAIPLLIKPGRTAVAVFMGTFAFQSVLGHLSSPPWQTWMADLIPRRIRGRYFSMRRVWTIPIQVVIAISAGLLLDRYSHKLPEGVQISAANHPQLVWVVAIIIAVCAIFGTIDILLFLRMREIVSPPLVESQEPSGELQPPPGPDDWRRVKWLRFLPFRQRLFRVYARTLPPLHRIRLGLTETVLVLWDSVRSRQARHFGLYSATIMFASTMGGSYFMVNALKNVGMSKLGNNITFMVCGALSSMIMARSWGRLIDMWGRRPVLLLATTGVVFSTAGWFFIPPGSSMLWAYAMGILSCMWGGVMWGAIELARTNYIMGFAETAGRSKFIAANSVFTALGGFLGGFLGGHVAQGLEFLQTSPLVVGPFHWNNYHVTFFLSSAARAASIIWLVNLPDPGSRPFKDVIIILIRRCLGLLYVRRVGSRP